ncbi:regulatory protein RecX [Paludibacterium denitrificans]|uniref:regulatory protein RecX n=1 Tax=Paludibacterium denitrificans TaxID=2675226 RepID=UPI002477FAE0|nr:regulatory protein RecX [Paludibacterium denitrificans]
MRERGVSSEDIASALAEQDDLATARQQWQRKFGQRPTTPQDKARQIRFLAARGFPMDIIRQVLLDSSDDFPLDEA